MSDIWNRWIKHYEKLGIDPKRICKDGIMCELFDPGFKTYSQASSKILFVLKETNGLDGDLRKFLEDGPRYMWHTVARWAAGILNDFPRYEVANDIKKEALKKIAAINLKKTSGGAKAVPEIISAYVHQDRELLLEQIALISPDLIISCGVMDQLIWLLDLKINPEKPSNEPLKDTTRNIWIVPFRHPARAGGKEIYNKLKEIVLKCKDKLKN